VPSRPPYIIKTEDDEARADNLDGAYDAAAKLYDPAGSIPEIVDDDGLIVGSPTTTIDRIMEYLNRK
jgi:hypothetical protein